MKVHAAALGGCNLHLRHAWGGGLGRWVDDFAGSDPHSRNLILEPYGSPVAFSTELRLSDGRSGTEFGSWALERPIAEIADGHEEYRRILESIVAKWGVSHLYVSSLVGHALDALELGVPTTIVHHDYHPYCAAFFSHFSDVCADCPRVRLEACLRTNPLSRPSRKNGADHWLAIRARWLELATRDEITHVAPTPSVARQFATLEQRLADVTFHVIPHGQRVAPDYFGGADESRRLRLVLLGRLTYGKGLADFHAIAAELLQFADVALLGASLPGAAFAHLPGIEYVSDYTQAELTAHLERLRPDLALLLSIHPETFSYTLSEAWAHRIPAAARRLGGFSDRIAHGQNGFHVGPDASRVLADLRELDADRARIRRAQRQLPTIPGDGMREMIDRYYSLRERRSPAVAGRPVG